jgi:hypothetical protein
MRSKKMQPPRKCFKGNGKRAGITVKDLPQSDALDRQALQAIAGGSRTGARPIDPRSVQPGQGPIVDYPSGFGARRRTAAGTSR